MMAPAVGRLIAEAIAGAEPDPALHALAPQRFAEGRSVPEPQVV
jgi:glycine/D-amino acid oxidase-like deaminating enzyme